MRARTTTYRIVLVAIALGVSSGRLYAMTPKLPFNLFPWKSSTAAATPEPAPVPSASQKADLQMSVGRSLERDGRLEEAVGVYQDVLKKDAHCIEAYQRLAVVNDQLGNFQESDKNFRAGIKRDPKNAELLCDRGYSLYLQNRDADAEQALRDALAVKPNMARAHNNLALILAHVGRNDQSLAEFSQAGCPEAEARVNLAFCLMARREWMLARQELQRASVADPNAATIKPALAYLRAKAPPEVAETVPILPVSKPAIAETPTAVVNAAPAPIAATATSYEIPQVASDTAPPLPMTKATFSESISRPEVARSEHADVQFVELGDKLADAAGKSANQASPSAPSVVKLAIPAAAPPNAAVQSVGSATPTASKDLASASSQPKAGIQIVDHTDGPGTVSTPEAKRFEEKLAAMLEAQTHERQQRRVAQAQKNVDEANATLRR